MLARVPLDRLYEAAMWVGLVPGRVLGRDLVLETLYSWGLRGLEAVVKHVLAMQRVEVDRRWAMCGLCMSWLR